MSKTAVVTGAGSGVGQATAVMLAQQGWNVAILGRRKDALDETLAQSGEAAERVLVCPCDVGQQSQVQATAAIIAEKDWSVDVVVNAAGTNFKQRYLPDISLED